MVKPVRTIIPKDLENLGVSVLFGADGLYHCIDTDGMELKAFELKWKALAYLREVFALQIEAETVEEE